MDAICGEVASSSTFASSPSPTISSSPTLNVVPETQTPTQNQPQTLSQSSGLPPLGRKPIPQKLDVWDHYDKYEEVVEFVKEDGCKSSISKKRARCKYCFANYAADPSINGTSTLRKHIEIQCKKYPERVSTEKRQKTFSFNQAFGGLTSTGHTKEDWLRSCMEWVVMDELPFSVVDGKGFRKFCDSLNPHFQVPSRRTLVRHFLTMFDAMKEKLKADLALHRVCLTTDTWTSVQNINYMVITTHFIDSEWNLHKRVLNFCVINHKGNSIGKLLESCLFDWGLTTILTITANNASSNTKALEYLKSKMHNGRSGKVVFGGKYLHVRCCAHIVNLIVRDGLKKLEKSILSIRNAVKYVRSSPQRLEEFKACVMKEEIDCKRLVVLDMPTRWNSTYMMLEAALKFEKAFNRMGNEDPFASWFAEDELVLVDKEVIPSHEAKRVGPPNDEDWSNARIFVNFLKVFYEATLKMSLSLHMAAHTTVHDLIAMEGEIDDLFIGEDMILTKTYTSLVLNEMALSMKQKFEKYWGDIDKVNQLLLVALVLDPRYKLGNLEFVLKSRFENPEDATKKKNEVKELLMKLYEEYVIPPPPNQSCDSSATSETSQTSNTNTTSMHQGGRKRRQLVGNWIKESKSSDTVILSHEIDRYITDPIESVVPDFDILRWWKLSGVKYPSLTLIAKDVLAILVSMVASESCFSTGGRVVNSFRASLTPTIVEALICAQNWLKSDDISFLEYESTIQEMKSYELIEKDVMKPCIPTNSSKATLQ